MNVKKILNTNYLQNTKNDSLDREAKSPQQAQIEFDERKVNFPLRFKPKPPTAPPTAPPARYAKIYPGGPGGRCQSKASRRRSRLRRSRRHRQNKKKQTRHYRRPPYFI
jgi:hypothetical protein